MTGQESKMELQIDYLKNNEQVYIENKASGNKLWRSFYVFICDYIPATVVSYSESNISFPWRYFISIKGYIGNFITAHREQLRVEFTEQAKIMMKVANNNSYATSIACMKRSEKDIQEKLRMEGFIRKLTNNQMDNLKKISQLPGAATFSVPGAGKTTEALAYFFVNRNQQDRLLVVAPKNAFGAWDEQLDSCIKENKECFMRLRGGESAIREMLEKHPRFMLITYDQLPRVKKLISSLLAEGNIYMFLDESHRIKGGKRAKRAEAILDIAHLPKKKLVMSGTPMPQSPKDLIPQFLFLYPTKNVDEKNVIDMIQPIYVRTTKGQLKIPEVKHIVKTVKMSRLQREIYMTLKSEIKRQMNPMLSDSSRYELRRIGKCVMKVMEFVSNPALLSSDMNYVFDKRIGSLLVATDGPKIEYVCRRARDLAKEKRKVIIWSCFVQNVELIALRLKDLGAEYIHGGVDAGNENDQDTREGKIKRFHSDPKCMVLVANPAACSEGISLHRICQYAIYLDRSFNAAHYLQSEDRIHRLGLSSDARPTVEFVECEDSIDQVVRERLTLKVAIMASALNDSSLKVEPDIYEEDEEDESDMDNIANDLSVDDARAVIDYFFDGDSDA